MKSLTFIILLTIVASLTSCGDSTTTNEQVSSEKQTPIIETEKLQKGILTNFSKEDVARFAISSIMGQPSNSIKVKNENVSNTHIRQ